MNNDNNRIVPPSTTVRGVVDVFDLDDESPEMVACRIERFVYKQICGILLPNINYEAMSAAATAAASPIGVDTSAALAATSFTLHVPSRTLANTVRDNTTGAFRLRHRLDITGDTVDGTTAAARYDGMRQVRDLGRYVRIMLVMSCVHQLIITGRHVSQREMYYMLLRHHEQSSLVLFPSQQRLNDIIMDVAAILHCPRAALNVGAATRGVVAGCVTIVRRHGCRPSCVARRHRRRLLVGEDLGRGVHWNDVVNDEYDSRRHAGDDNAHFDGSRRGGSGCCGESNSNSFVDGRYVGVQGWPIPGHIDAVRQLTLDTPAKYILVVEKMGVFVRLVEDRFFDRCPCVLVCGKGYPSIATRAFISMLVATVNNRNANINLVRNHRRKQQHYFNDSVITVLGIADHNPHGLALLLCYRYGSARACIEGNAFVSSVHWLGLRASQIERLRNIAAQQQHSQREEEEDVQYVDVGVGTPLTKNDWTTLNRVTKKVVQPHRRESLRYELQQMPVLGKFELQCLYAHPQGTSYLSTFVEEAIVRGDYIAL